MSSKKEKETARSRDVLVLEKILLSSPGKSIKDIAEEILDICMDLETVEDRIDTIVYDARADEYGRSLHSDAE